MGIIIIIQIHSRKRLIEKLSAGQKSDLCTMLGCQGYNGSNSYIGDFREKQEKISKNVIPLPFL